MLGIWSGQGEKGLPHKRSLPKCLPFHYLKKKKEEKKQNFIRIHLYQGNHKTFTYYTYYKVNENDESVFMNTYIWNQVLGDHCAFQTQNPVHFWILLWLQILRRFQPTQISSCKWWKILNSSFCNLEYVSIKQRQEEIIRNFAHK